ncbi:hypothetical protein [Actinomadura miaoliensis]|uniref:Uncharacterized protein n=1 Tax=Actinomadura miaoliensis TaxID=430685 RepID=A0ABP7W517_9ACTN
MAPPHSRPLPELKARFVFDSPQHLGQAQVTELIVDADRITFEEGMVVARQAGTTTYTVAPEILKEIDLTELERRLAAEQREKFEQRMAKTRPATPTTDDGGRRRTTRCSSGSGGKA